MERVKKNHVSAEYKWLHRLYFPSPRQDKNLKLVYQFKD